ncbi:MAG: TIGR01777 family oxidoreductase [Pseudomonadota bacterium]
MHILMTGGTGFIGTPLANSLLSDGHRVTILSRSLHKDGGLCRYITSLDAINEDETIDGIINLAGASLAEKRWSGRYKQQIVSSRLDTTRVLLALIERVQQKPAVLLSASAIGFYGPQGDEALAEDAARGRGFAADLCVDWEAEALMAEASGLRVCLLRLGVVLDRHEGAFVELERPFKLGVANWIGNGHQVLSWIHRRDAVAAIRHILYDETATGAFNVTAPVPVTSRELCTAMKVQRRTFITLPVPGIALRLAVGEMANELLISGQRVLPQRLQAAGFEFEFADIDAALASIYAG